jgi:hypothetical protein
MKRGRVGRLLRKRKQLPKRKHPRKRRNRWYNAESRWEAFFLQQVWEEGGEGLCKESGKAFGQQNH